MLPVIRLAGRQYQVTGREPERTMELYALLARLVDLNMAEMRKWQKVPPIAHTHVRYRRERGREHWQTASELLRSGYGDCEDLAAYECARLRLAGLHRTSIDLDRTPVGWHVITKLPDGRVWDPSIKLGMGSEADI